MSSITRSMLLVLLSIAALALVSCAGGGGSGGSGGPTTPTEPIGPDRSGAWTLDVAPTSPCAGDPAVFTISADLVQHGTTLTGSGCDATGNAATVTINLVAPDNTHFTGNVSGCQSVNADCHAPYVFGSCVRIPIEGDITGSSVAGTYSLGSTCNASGTFTGTIAATP